MQPLNAVPRHTAISISAKIRFIRASLVSSERTIFGAQITSVFVCNETCDLKHLPHPGSSRNPVCSEIFGFRTHNSWPDIAGVQCVEEMNGHPLDQRHSSPRPSSLDGPFECPNSLPPEIMTRRTYLGTDGDGTGNSLSRLAFVRKPPTGKSGTTDSQESLGTAKATIGRQLV
jgi:hypothetical protein